MCKQILTKIAYDNLRSQKLFTKENSCVRFLNDFDFLSKSVRLSNLLFQKFYLTNGKFRHSFSKTEINCRRKENYRDGH